MPSGRRWSLARCKYQAQLDEYKRFSKVMKLPEQRERIYYDMKGRVAPPRDVYQQYLAEQAEKRRRIQTEADKHKERAEEARRAVIDKAIAAGLRARGEFQNGNGKNSSYEAPDIVGLGNSAKDKKIENALKNSIDNVVNMLNQSSNQTYHKSLLSGIIDTSEYRYDSGDGAPFFYNRATDIFYFRDSIVEYLDADEKYVITHDASHKLDNLFFRSWDNQPFLDALERCAEKAYPMKNEIEEWFEKGGKYYSNYAVGDVFSALFYGKIHTNVQRIDEDYYYRDETRMPTEIFADLSSLLSFDECNEPLFEELADVIRKELY